MFSSSFQGLGILQQKFPDVPVLALTATATISVKEDVVQALGLVNCIIFRQSFNRPNLRYQSIKIKHFSNKKKQIILHASLILPVMQILCHPKDKEMC